jgi:3-dehydroquinate synthase
MTEIPVDLGQRRYTVSVGSGLVQRLSRLLASHRGRRVVLVGSRRVLRLHGSAVLAGLRELRPVAVVRVPDGERFKSAATLGRVYDELLRARLGRDGLVVALGGGVVGDLAGYAAATWLRGVDWVGLPSTLLSMVDSSVGGKVGINHPRGKNLIGAFHQPRAVVADTALLRTLPPREIRSGAFEVLKCAILADRSLFASLLQAPPGLVGWGAGETERAVAAAVRVKADVVSRDEREGGLRRVLNLGHTIGHALETLTRYRRFTHGEAVGWGLVGAAAIARERGLLAARVFETIVRAVDQVGTRPRMSDLAAGRLLDAIGRDKKVRAGRVVFVLPAAIGRVVIRDDVAPAEILRALRVMATLEKSARTTSPSG